MMLDEIPVAVAMAKVYAARRALAYLPCFKKRPDGAFYDEPLPGWKAIGLLELAGVVPRGTFDSWRRGEAEAVARLDRFSWCEVCRDAPVARGDGLCVWCSLAPLGNLRRDFPGRRAVHVA